MSTRNVRWRITNRRAGLVRFAISCAAMLSLFLASVWIPQAAPIEPQNMLGVWQGFFQSNPTDPTIPPDPQVPVTSEINSQDFRRISGVLGIVPCSLTLNGTVTANGKVNLQGQDEHHHAVAKLDLHEFDGGAAVLNGSLALMASGGQVTNGTLLLLRPFAGPVPGDDVPNPAGLYRGPFRDADSTSGELIVFLPTPDPQHPTRLTGQVALVVGLQREVFNLIGTINAAGKLVIIAQGRAGHVILDATWSDPPDDGLPATITGRHTFELNDGSVHEGTFSLTRV